MRNGAARGTPRSRGEAGGGEARSAPGGFLAALGSLLAAVGAAALPQESGAARGFVAGLLLASGFAALLGGLSGKPRPTGWAALLLLAAGVVVALFAVR